LADRLKVTPRSFHRPGISLIPVNVMPGLRPYVCPTRDILGGFLMNDESNTDGKRTWMDEIEVKSEELVNRVKQLAADNKVKRIRVVEPDGDIALEIPLTYGAIAGGAVVLAAPVLAILGALGAFVAKVKIEVVKEEDTETEDAAT